MGWPNFFSRGGRLWEVSLYQLETKINNFTKLQNPGGGLAPPVSDAHVRSITIRCLCSVARSLQPLFNRGCIDWQTCARLNIKYNQIEKLVMYLTMTMPCVYAISDNPSVVMGCLWTTTLANSAANSDKLTRSGCMHPRFEEGCSVFDVRKPTNCVSAKR